MRNLGLVILVAGVVLAMVWIIGVLAIPNKAVELIDGIPIKFLIIVLGDLIILALGVLVYVLRRCSPRALAQRAFHFFLWVGLTSSFVPVGLSSLERITAGRTGEEAWFDIKFAGTSSAIIFIATGVITFCYARLHFEIARYEGERGVLL